MSKQDGECTFFPEGNWLSCCAEHDEYYAKGGSYQDKLLADKKLRYCIKRSKHPVVAWIAFIGVRLAGSRLLPKRWRFGKNFEY